MLEIKNLTVQYRNNLPAVEDFNLSMKKGEIIGIVGESGSGKTTIIRAIMGAIADGGEITSGEIWFQGKPLLGIEKEEWRQLRGTKISMIFQESGATLNPVRRIGSQYVEYLRTHEKVSKRTARALGISMLEKVGLSRAETIMDSFPQQLSGGMRQRVNIAMAMTFHPQLLLADEPTSALDVTTQAQVAHRMMELCSSFETGIIMVTHNLGLAAYMADQLIVMRKGRIVERGNREEVLCHPVHEYTKQLLQAIPE